MGQIRGRPQAGERAELNLCLEVFDSGGGGKGTKKVGHWHGEKWEKKVKARGYEKKK